MAEAVLSIVSQGIKPLGDLIVQEANLLSGVAYQVELAQVELHLMGAFMKDADSRSGDDEVVRIWVKLIRDIAYDLEDVIESFALKVVLRRRGGTVKLALKSFTCFISEGVDRHRIGSEIQDIMNKLSSLRSSLQSYNIRQSDPEKVAASKIQKQRDWRLTYGHEIGSHIVGLEESTYILVKELVREGKHHRVVSIWGMGGSGKTTLAKQVFLQDEVKRHFDYSAWVCISQPCDGRAALEEIFIKLTSPTDEGRKQIAKMKKDEIAEKLCRIQRVKRCLLILDDIWTQEAWRSLKAGFPVSGETESRILLTTRKKEVALLASTNDFVHQPQPLDEKQSWDLFEKIAISESDRTDLEIYAKKRELGNKMLVHCSGLPLAITVLAGLLSRRDTIDEWDTVHRNVDKYIMRGTNVLDRETTNLEYGVSGVLALSYDDLPSQLKLCFLYLAQFPEDHEIHVKRLTQLWIAEGFITSTSDIHGSVELMEDVAYGCLIELVERSMVQIVKYGLTGKVKTCRLHDLMRDMCLQKAKQENFLDIVNFSSGHASRTAVIGKVRRRVVYLDKNVRYESSSRDGRDDHIRSLLYFTPEAFDQKWSKRVRRSVFNDFRLLRVLKLENTDRKLELPKAIGNLVHLRFLSLKESVFNELPSSVSNLVLLQTLDLRSYSDLSIFCCFGCESGIKIRNVFRNMEQLRHLYLPEYHTVSGQKLSLARLHNLQTLVNMSLKRCDLNDFVHLTNLKKLGIIESQSGRLEKLKSVLISTGVTFEHLRSLSVVANRSVGDILRDIVLRCPQLYKLRLDGKMTELPKELLNYPNLTKITLLGTDMKDNQIEILEKLPKLRVLSLDWNSFRLETVVFSKGGFPHLEFLTLEELQHLKEWRVEKEAMPCLHRLCIRHCQQLLAIPDGIKNITTLKELTIDLMPRTFCDRLAEVGDDFYKIKHVPSLILTNVLQSSTEMEEAAGASEVVVGLAGESDQESTVEAPPPADEKTEEIQASSTPNVPY